MSSTSESSSDDDDRGQGHSDNEGSGSDQAGHNRDQDSAVMVRVTSVSPVTMVKTERMTGGTMTGLSSMTTLLAVPWISKLHLCPSHEAGSMTRDCSKCSAALTSLFLASVQITNSAFTPGFVCV